eukprot:626325-Prymnesium_polylepis.1
MVDMLGNAERFFAFHDLFIKELASLPAFQGKPLDSLEEATPHELFEAMRITIGSLQLLLALTWGSGKGTARTTHKEAIGLMAQFACKMDTDAPIRLAGRKVDRVGFNMLQHGVPALYWRRMESEPTEGCELRSEPSGLKWEVASAKSTKSKVELNHEKLADALASKLDFTQNEWDAFGISDLRTEHF